MKKKKMKKKAKKVDAAVVAVNKFLKIFKNQSYY